MNAPSTGSGAFNALTMTRAAGGRSGLGRAFVLTALVIVDAACWRGLVLVGAVVDDLQDLNEAEGGPEAAKGRLQLGVGLGHVAHDAGCSGGALAPS
jgi:hypothetical protein